MPNRFPFPLRLLALACAAAVPAAPQPAASFLALMDRFASGFAGARADIRSVNHVQGVPEDDVETGTILIRRSGVKTQFLIQFTAPNVYSLAVRDQSAEVYRPKLNEIQEYDLRAYKDVAQKLFLLGFGMPGKELAANYQVRTLKREIAGSQPATHLDLIPKSPEVLKQLRSVEVWFSDATECPIQQVFHLADGGVRTAQFSSIELNPKFPAGAFDLPKGAHRVRVN